MLNKIIQFIKRFSKSYTVVDREYLLPPMPRYRVKGYKPRNFKEKKIISLNKFNRVFSSNLENAGVATIRKNHKFINSLQAVQLGNHVYSRFPCNEQAGNKLESYCVRYDLNNPVEYIQFRTYPQHVIPSVDF
jgi:hypothetical protein